MKKLLIFIFSVLACASQAQNITGNTTVNLGDQFEYAFNNGTIYMSVTWATQYGSVVSTRTSGTTYYATIQWTSPGTGALAVLDQNHTQQGSLTVTSNLVTPNTTYTIVQNCNSTTVTRNTNPPAGVNWYWQTSATGTSTTNNTNTNTITVTASMYLRARWGTTGAWSTSSQSVPSTTVVSPLAAPATSTNGNRISDVAVAVPVSVSSVTSAGAYWWYTQSSGGTPISGQTTVSYSPTVSTTTTYYVASVIGNCPSTTRKAVTANVYPAPVVATTYNGQVTMGRAVTLSTSNMTYDTYQWLDGNGNAISGATSPTYSTTTAGNYKLTVSKATSGNFTIAAFTVVTDMNSQQLNYIVSNTILADNIMSESQIKNLPKESNSQTIQYFDGLGRPLQTVTTQGSPNGFDMVQPVEYDSYGREVKKYLPYTSTQSNGWYKTSALTSLQSNFYNTPTDNIADDAAPYAQMMYEASPLNRLLKQGAPGAVWQPDAIPYPTTTDHAVKQTYEANDANEVLLWTYSFPSSMYAFGLVNAGTAAAPVYYAANQLTRTRGKDADQHEVVEYKDLAGRTVLRKVQVDALTYAQTYYVYDDFGQLVCVLPPEAVNAITSYLSQNNPGKDAFLNTWAYRYNYDARHRITVKKVPGSDYVAMIYDKRDRHVMTRDANQRTTNEWTFIKYDAMNRPVLTGKYVNAVVDSIQQATVDAYYANLSGSQAWYESYKGSTGVVQGYDNNSWPQVSTDANYYSVSYYDSYDAYNAPAGYTYTTESPALAGQDLSFTRMQGKPVASQTKNLNTGTWMRTVTYVDGKYRPLQVISDHQKGTTRVTNVYDFPGRVITMLRTYVVNAATTTIKESFTFDHASRLLQVKHSMNGAADVITSQNVYNELGQLADKKLHSTDNGATFKQSVDYRYNIRGWMTRINNADVSTIASSTDGDNTYDYFGMEFGYNNSLTGTTATAQYNGNITATQWGTGVGTASKRQSYAYTYDMMNRLLTSSHAAYKSSAWNTESGAYSENITSYDLNGNINGLTRTGSNGVVMDNLSYSYTGNVLNYVHDTGNATAGFVNGNTGTDDYAYDSNGNLFKDKNKGINNNGDIKYNFLNLPTEITKSTGEKVKYYYDATGRKLSQEVYAANGTTIVKTTDYIGELIYENNTLRMIQEREGRVLPDGAMWEYQYHIKDHLGNVRVTFTAKTQVTTSYTATFETSNQTTEAANFQHYPSGGQINTLAANAHAGTNSQYLNGGYNGQVGIAKSFSVLPGDVVQIQGYAKYATPSSTAASFTNFTASLLAAFNLSAPGVGETGTPAAGVNAFGSWEIGGGGDESKSDPVKVFATIILFDKNYNFIDVAYSATTGSGTLISQSYTVKEPGYAYLYVSNENTTLTDVYFDDVTMSVTPSQIVSVSDYYAFGLQFNNSERTGTYEQRNLYNGKELQDELSINWYDYGARMYMPEIGRWGIVDPLAEKSRRWSPYNYALNNPLRYIDPDGRSPFSMHRTEFFGAERGGPDLMNKVVTTSTTYSAYGLGAIESHSAVTGYVDNADAADASKVSISGNFSGIKGVSTAQRGGAFFVNISGANLDPSYLQGWTYFAAKDFKEMDMMSSFWQATRGIRTLIIQSHASYEGLNLELGKPIGEKSEYLTAEDLKTNTKYGVAFKALINRIEQGGTLALLGCRGATNDPLVHEIDKLRPDLKIIMAVQKVSYFQNALQTDVALYSTEGFLNVHTREIYESIMFTSGGDVVKY